jgi:hypothetical protein
MVTGSVNRLSQPFWASGQQDIQGLEVSEVSRSAPEGTVPPDIDDGALTAYGFLTPLSQPFLTLLQVLPIHTSLLRSPPNNQGSVTEAASAVYSGASGSLSLWAVFHNPNKLGPNRQHLPSCVVI